MQVVYLLKQLSYNSISSYLLLGFVRVLDRHLFLNIIDSLKKIRVYNIFYIYERGLFGAIITSSFNLSLPVIFLLHAVLDCLGS